MAGFSHRATKTHQCPNYRLLVVITQSRIRSPFDTSPLDPRKGNSRRLIRIRTRLSSAKPRTRRCVRWCRRQLPATCHEGVESASRRVPVPRSTLHCALHFENIFPGRARHRTASLRLPITIILFNNGSFGWIKMLQKLYHGERYLGVDFTGKMDAVAIAEAFGIRGMRITHPDQLGPAITEAMGSNEPTFIDVPTKSELEEVPPVHAWQAALQEESTPNRSR